MHMYEHIFSANTTPVKVSTETAVKYCNGSISEESGDQKAILTFVRMLINIHTDIRNYLPTNNVYLAEKPFSLLNTAKKSMIAK